jgi:nucleotide-binding universal stress UspA family protein
MAGISVPLIIVGAWILVGLLSAAWMARRGHRDPAWLFMAVVLGPVMAAAASERVQRRPRRLARMESGEESAGHLRVLVGFDGSAESQAALDLAVDVLGPCARGLVVAEVVDYDAAEADMRGRVVAAKQRLSDAAQVGGGSAMTCEVLAGPPAQALARFAREHDIDMVIVGRHGGGLSKRLLGNVAQELMREERLPVLVAGRGAGR